MPDNKLTDNEIIKALECCINYNDCDKCDFEPKDNKKKTIGCCLEIMKNALDLITRQQARVDDLERDELPRCKDALKRANEMGIELQAENERLKEKQEKCFYCTEQANKKISEIKAEAYKEFAERLKEQYAVYNGMEYVKVDLKTLLNTIDNLVKEMVGGNNEG